MRNSVRPESSENVSLFIIGAVVMAIVTIAGVITVAVLVPSNASIITTIVGISSPIILAFLGVGLQGIHRLVNSNLENVRTDLRAALGRISELQNEKVVVAADHAEKVKQTAIEAAEVLSTAVEAAKVALPVRVRK